MLCRSGIENNGVVLCRKTRWREVVVGIEPTPLDAVFGVREIREIDFGGVVADTGSERHAKFVLGGRKFKVVVRIRKSGIQEKLTCEQMVPAQGSDAIAPRHINSETSVVVFKREDILAVISTQINAVFIGEFVVEFGIEVVEEITWAGKWRGVWNNGLGEDIDVGAAGRHHKRTAVFFERTFDSKSRWNDTDSAFDFEFFEVAFVHVDL